MKRRIYLFLLTVAILSLLAVAFAFTASAEEEIKVTYNWIGGYQYDEAKPNDDGSYTLRVNKKSGDGTISLADGTVVYSDVAIDTYNNQFN